MKKILLAGGTGLVGSRLTDMLIAQGYHVHILSRRPHQDHGQVSYFQWDTAARQLDAAALEVDAIVNLAGAGIADKRWTADRKKTIIQSRTDSAALIAQALASHPNPPYYLGASAIGYYGDQGPTLLNENSPAGSDFLSTSCQAWESAHHAIAQHSDTAILRIGIVLSTDGGALPKMLMTKGFRIFSYFGDGSQWYSWIHIDDLCRMIIHLVEQRLTGTYNAVAPHPQTNKALMETLLDSTSLSGLLLPAPRAAMRLAMGEMADIVLDSTRVSAQKILDTGFKFTFPKLEAAFRDLF